MTGLIGYIMVFIIMGAIAGAGAWWFFHCRGKPKYNGLLWVHPDLGNGIIDIQKQPTGRQKPFYFNYHQLEFGIAFFRRPLWLWAQDKKIDEKTGEITYPIVHWEPVIPADHMLPSTAEGEPDKAHPYVTPNELYDTTDWECLRKLETAKSSIVEAIKLGMAIAMVGICLFGIIVALDMIGKKDVPVASSAPTSMVLNIDHPEYWGLLK